MWDVTVWCVSNVINNIDDTFVKNCVEWNIVSNTWLNSMLNSWSVTTGYIKDMDSLVKECVSYKLSNNNVDANNTPLFNSFLASAGWVFVWSWIANSFLWAWRYNYNMPISNSMRSAYYSDCNTYNNGDCKKWWAWTSRFIWRSYVNGASSSYMKSSATSVSSSSKSLGKAWSSWSSAWSSSLW